MLNLRLPLLFVAIPVLGGIGWPVSGDDAPPASTPRLPAPAGNPAKEPSRIVLMTDGRVVKGVLSEEHGMLVVTQPIGAMRFSKKRVEKVFDTMPELYAHKLEQLPENDFDERIKLARWCLAQRMEPEAREQLGAILQKSPDHVQAKAMMISLDQAEARAGMAKHDPEIQQTAGEQVLPAPGEQALPAAGARPGALDASVISNARRGMGISELPVVFDLPQAQAVKRADEFGRFVQPVLQNYCARCHNDRYDGVFQLIQFKTRIDRTREATRANLDATLRLIDRENPTRSELLSSALRPHGRGPNPRPIFQGSNDRAYQILATWANKLQAKPTAEGVVAAGFAASSPGAESGETFASHRGRISNEVESSAGVARRFSTGPVDSKSLPPARAVPGRGMVADTSSDPNEFPVPFAVAGARPQAAPAPASEPRAPTANQAPAEKPAVPSAKAATAEEKDPAGTETNAVPAPAKNKPKKTLKLDPNILQRALQLRNQNQNP